MTQNRLKKQNVIKAESRKTGNTPYEIMFNRNVRRKKKTNNQPCVLWSCVASEYVACVSDRITVH